MKSLTYFESRTIIYQYVCNITKDSDIRRIAYELSDIDYLKLILDAELPPSVYRGLGVHFQLVSKFLAHPIHARLRNLTDIQRYCIARMFEIDDLEHKPLSTLDSMVWFIDSESFSLKDKNIILPDFDRNYYIGLLAYNIAMSNKDVTLHDPRIRLIYKLVGSEDADFTPWLDDNIDRAVDPQTRRTWFDMCPYCNYQSKITQMTPYWVVDILY
jgi:hypothetical protein